MYKSATVLRVCGNFLITHLGFIIPTIKARNDKMKIRVNNIALMFEKNKDWLEMHGDLSCKEWFWRLYAGIVDAGFEI